MASLAWDRLLETFFRKQASFCVLTADAPPLMLIDSAWRELQVPPLTQQQLAEMAGERLYPKPDVEKEGYGYVDFWYGDLMFLRVTAFGWPHPKFLTITRVKTDPDPSHVAGALR